MKKAFDQTVRDLKREVNKKVLKVPGIEQKILDATSNEPWGPHGSHLADIAQATRNYHEYQMIMHVIWKRLNDTGKNWRHVYKALTVLEYLVGHGSERVIDEIRERAYQIQTLSDFQYIDSSARDQGSNVRRKSQSLVALVNDKEKIQEVRQKAAANRDKYRSTYSTGGRNSYPGAGGYGDRYDDDRSEGRYRDEDRNGYGRERDWGSRDDERYGRGGDSYNRDGDRYGRDSDERYGRDNYRDDDFRGGRGSDDHQFGPRNRSFDRDGDRFSEDDDRYSSRHNGGRADGPSQDEKRFECKLSEQSPPPSYEESVKDTRENVQGGRGVGNVGPSATKAYSPPASKASSPASISHDPKQSAAGISASALNKEGDEFDEFDPRGSMPATTAPATGAGIDLFGNQSASDPINSLALVPVSFGTTSEADVPENSGVGTNFVPLSAASTAFSQPNEDPFGDGPFKATTQDNFQAQQQGFASVTSFQPSGVVQGAEPPAPSKVETAPTAPTFDFGDPLGGLTYTPAIANGHQQFAANPPSMAGEFPAPQANYSFHGAVLPPGSSGFVSQQPVQQLVSSGFIPQQPVQQPGSASFAPRQPAQQPVSLGFVPQQPVQQPAYTTNMHTTNVNYLPQSAPPTTLAPQPAAQPVGAPNLQTTTISHLSQPGFSSSLPALPTALAATGQPAKAQPPKEFETKSTVWADTLNRGLVNLNISGAKVNPLADIGVDFDAINRMEKRKEKISAAPISSTITMGKAMGSGSGIGRASAGGLAPPSNPMVGSGMGMGMGMGMGAAGGMGRGPGTGMGMGMGAGGVPGMGMGMGVGMSGYGGGMNQPMGIGMGMNRGMGMNQASQMRPPAQGPGMPGVGYNPMMGTGMGGYGSQQPYGGGYR